MRGGRMDGITHATIVRGVLRAYAGGGSCEGGGTSLSFCNSSPNYFPTFNTNNNSLCALTLLPYVYVV